MRTVTLTIAATTLAAATAFQSPISAPQTARVSTTLFEYIPSGFNKQSWKAFQAKEQKKKDDQAKKNLGAMGPKGYQSRSFQSFQEALERGEATHLLPVENAAARLKSGELKPEDIPYMQRGGSWDNSDIKGAKKNGWLKSDKDYAAGGFKKEQSVSVFGFGKGLDWTGSRDKEGPSMNPKPGKFAKNYKAPTISQLKGQTVEKPKKKMFGLF
mmetsp:Transcript_13601/g.29569  ORF Transcript_13601/g.29569 Transcript_13601/m.29569 type:complete len:213 (+) Transcript_13601:229-867(+)|eukprot:CAMPEP_0172302340 /NCGR_PEP_ID=MMETSP1058-20130122/4048_1 /TAXON_ID=83371 /ORGANISM="Detonula confervacea, Strain CCMP 353" /LENGTH=212 /DNA_ID=CAMNT_0013012773 /DNA_START=185 /DNA_END=823 /DNA_ORIENTATION=+